MDAALEKAVRVKPEERTDALSALVEDLRQPNPNLGYERPKPFLARNPIAFWRTLAIALAVVNLVLLVFLARR
jgi:hypothetical protein